MKTLLKLAFAAAVLFTVTSCSTEANAVNKSDKTITNKLEVSSFHEIEASSVIQVVYTQSQGEYSATVTMPENAEEYFSYKCDGDKLKFWLNNKKHKSIDGDVIVRISSPYISDIDISGASKFSAEKINQVNKDLEIDCSGASSVSIKEAYVNELEADCSGASHIDLLNLNAKSVDIDCSGASGANLSGKTNEAKFDACGASTISAQKLKAKEGKAEASGASNVNCSIENLYSRRSSGASHVNNE